MRYPTDDDGVVSIAEGIGVIADRLATETAEEAISGRPERRSLVIVALAERDRVAESFCGWGWTPMSREERQELAMNALSQIIEFLSMPDKPANDGDDE